MLLFSVQEINLNKWHNFFVSVIPVLLKKKMLFDQIIRSVAKSPDVSFFPKYSVINWTEYGKA